MVLFRRCAHFKLKNYNIGKKSGLHPMTIHEFTADLNFFVNSLKMYVEIMNTFKIDIFQRVKNILSILNSHHPVYGCFSHVLYNLTKPVFVEHRFRLSSTSS